ncbi:MAG: hypothetical protein ABIB79_03020 [archaeon]
MDIGDEIGQRTLCAGIKEYYSKEELKGKKTIGSCESCSKKTQGN